MINPVIKHSHFFGGLGGFAKGMNDGDARLGDVRAVFRCVGGIDSDAACVRDFERHARVPGTALDLFSLEQYVAFHGKQPPAGWREAMPADIHRAFNNELPDIGCMSSPCKGYSGLLSQRLSETAKYQALNDLALRGVWLYLEAYKDDPVPVLLFENVPRIATRGRLLLDRIEQLLSAYGYASAETTHDCGEIGALAQSRKRFLLIARHIEKVPPFIYEPVKHPLRAVGEVLGAMALPGDPIAGPMHRVPKLHWKTWVRLAFVEAGKDWRSLNRLAVDDGFLRDYAIAREYHRTVYGVNGWDDPAPTITSNSRPGAGAFSVADPRFESADYQSSQYGVTDWQESANCVTSQRSPGQGKFSVADPRIDGDPRSVQMGVRRWSEPAPAVTASMWAGTGPNSVADPRIDGVKHNNCFRIVRWDENSPSVTGGGGPSAGGLAIADPRAGKPADELHGKYHITPYEDASRAVIAGRDNGGCYVADPRPANGWKGGKYRVTAMDEAAGVVIAESGTGNGAFAVADPRPRLDPEKREHYLTAGHYGVIPWKQPANAVTASGQHDNGYGSVADPRLPAATDRLVAVIRSLDNTWHRPFTTLELAALQGLVDPEEQYELDGLSDSAWRERIGNAVPPPTAAAIAGVIGTAILLARAGETFALGSTPIWVRPVAVALSVMQRKPA